MTTSGEKKRKPISKRLRFEIFKRDGFACRYCGATPMATLLQIEHVVPVSKGGTNDPANLVTSCEPCNAGKSNVELGECRLPPTFSAELIKEHAEQTREYLASQKALIQNVEDVAKEACALYERRLGIVMTKGEQASMRTFCKHLSLGELSEIIDLTIGKTEQSYYMNDSRKFRYFCKVCWNKIKGPQDTEAA